MTRELYDPYDEALWADPYPLYRRLRDEHPVYHQRDKDFYVLSRFADIYAVARDPARFSSAQGLTFEPDEIATLGLPPTFIMMDPPRHNVLRKLISKAFTSNRVHRLEPGIRAFVRQRLDRIATLGQCDLMAELASPLPTYVLAELLGVPESDRARFDPWSYAITTAAVDGAFKLSQAIGAVQSLFAYFGRKITEAREAPGDDLLSGLTLAEVDGQRLSDWDILGFCFVMIAGGNDTTAHQIGHAAAMFAERQDVRRALLEDPTLIPNALEEVLRLESSVQGLCRTTTCEVELHGQRIPKGSKVHMLFGAGNRDPREFGPTAEELDIHRPLRRHLAYSQGPHWCIGAHVARLEARVALEELLLRMPDYQVDTARAKRIPSAFTRGYEVLPFRA